MDRAFGAHNPQTRPHTPRSTVSAADRIRSPHRAARNLEQGQRRNRAGRPAASTSSGKFAHVLCHCRVLCHRHHLRRSGASPALAGPGRRPGLPHPTPIQAETIPALMAGRDVTGIAQTGTGKTAAFGLPLLAHLDTGATGVQALVLVPTRELAIQVSDAIESFRAFETTAVLPVYGGAPYGPQLRALRMGVDVVVGTPGRMIDLLERGAL